MGLLDEAIREHLELKRRRGADPGEIERLEREALGPVRRGGHEIHEAPPEAETELAATYPDEEIGPRWSGTREEVDDRPTELIAPDEFEELEVPGREPLGGVGVEPEAAPAIPVPPPPEEPAPPRHPSGGDDLLEQETVEHDVEGEVAAADSEPAEREDMLEETPEFLQDTPDHDRLWFEQRPPRDFDLDG